MNIGEQLELNIIDINHEGQGVGKKDGFIYFVEEAVPGDEVIAKVVDIKKNFAICVVKDYLHKSNIRVTNPCEYYPNCGGCQMLEINYDEQLKIKKNRVINDFKKLRINLDNVEVFDTIGVSNLYNYRNKTAFSVVENNGEVQIGTYAKKTHDIIDIEKCLLQDEICDKVLSVIKCIFKKYKIKPYSGVSKSGNVRHIVIRKNNHKQIMLIIVTNENEIKNSKKICDELVEKIPEIETIVQNINKTHGSQILGSKNNILYGNGKIVDYIGDLKFIISPHTFFQVNAEQTLRLYAKAIEYADISKNDKCFDLYCGIGTISLLAAKRANKVIGVEVVEQSIKDAKENAKNNGLCNAEFYTGKVEDVLPKLNKKGYRVDTIILDPPRKGCDKNVIKTICDIKPKKVVYVSCNPSTLARDVKLMEEQGYILKKIQPVDMFANTMHCEVVTLLQRIEM